MMGYIRHNAIIATAWQEHAVAALVSYAEGVGAQAVSGLAETNVYGTVCIMPDGSKEGWAESDSGNLRRASIREWLRSADANGMYFEWCEVAYGSDDCEASVVESAWHDTPPPPPGAAPVEGE